MMMKFRKPKTKIDENDELEALIANGDVAAAMSRLDNSVDSPCDRVFLSSARGCNSVLSSSSPSPASSKFALIITAAKSLCPKTPTEKERFMTLDLTKNDVTEDECTIFFEEKMLPFLIEEQKQRTEKSSLSSSSTATAIPPSRIYVALNDNATQDLKPILVPFARFLTKYLMMADNNNNNNVLIHCVLGRSRSVALVAAYMMFGGKIDEKKQELPAPPSPPKMLADVMDKITKVRSIAEVNPCFGAQIFSVWRREMMKIGNKAEKEEKEGRDC